MRVETQQHRTKTLKAAHAHVSMGRRHITDKHTVGRGASHGAAAILSQLKDVTDERERRLLAPTERLERGDPS